MTEPYEPNDDAENGAVRELVRRTLSNDTLAKQAPDILRGVQRRIRMRSRGRFFADGWSTTQARHAYLLIALITLLLAATAYYALVPMDIH
ncbi:MAG TPA: hypothetical protein VN894_03990 [Polyangiaceae bacterium]|nr:hypothetical protein [Polyangiaceae bacterium]